MKRRRLLVGVGLVVLTTAVAYLLITRLQSPIERDAHSAAEAFFNNKPDTLYAYMTDEEIKSMGLTKEKFRTLWAQLVEPRMSGLAPVGGRELVSDDNHTSASESQTFTLSNGRQIAVPMQVWTDLGHSRMAVTLAVLKNAWNVDYARKADHSFRVSEIFAANLAGIRKDRTALGAMGISGLYCGPELGYLSLETLERRQLALIAHEIPPTD